jgi:hypothetical protein
VWGVKGYRCSCNSKTTIDAFSWFAELSKVLAGTLDRVLDKEFVVWGEQISLNDVVRCILGRLLSHRYQNASIIRIKFQFPHPLCFIVPILAAEAVKDFVSVLS